MGTFEEYLDKAKDIAEDAADGARDFADEVTSRVRELTDDGKKVRELKQNAKEQASSLTLGAKEKLQGFFQDAGASKEIKQGISELEALPEFEGSILYAMEVQALASDLRRLDLIISDDRMDKDSVVEEIKRVIEKVQPSDEPQTDDLEQQWIARAKDIAFNACLRALDTLA
ncbi:MAG: hypothetical protein E7227_06320 [Clostridiales bacterium]|nr:hypothetical protein [Clostridiales bacterium]